MERINGKKLEIIKLSTKELVYNHHYLCLTLYVYQECVHVAEGIRGIPPLQTLFIIYLCIYV